MTDQDATAGGPIAGSTDRAAYTLAGGEIGCLMIHGWNGHPGELRPMAEYLHSTGLTVHVPQLAGHDGNPDNMAVASYSDWIQSVVAAWTALRQDRPICCVVGFSMGGTLALDLAAQRPREVRCVVTLSALTYLGRGWQSLALPVGRHLIKWYHPFSRAALRDPVTRGRIARQVPGLTLDVGSPQDVERVREMTKISIGAAYQLQLLTRVVRRRLARVKAPLLVIHGRLDRVANPRCAEDIVLRVASADKHIVWLERSHHMVPLDVDRHQAWERTARFIAAHTTTQSLRAPAQPLQ